MLETVALSRERSGSVFLSLQSVISCVRIDVSSVVLHLVRDNSRRRNTVVTRVVHGVVYCGGAPRRNGEIWIEAVLCVQRREIRVLEVIHLGLTGFKISRLV